MFSRPRRAFLHGAAGAAIALCLGPLARAADAPLSKEFSAGLSSQEWQAIRKVILQQLAALKAGNGGKAFGYATPSIQAQFGDARSFMAMVRHAYSPLLDARYSEFLEGAVIDGIIVQPLRLIAQDNTVLVALYTVERQKRGSWRISGCMIAPSTVQAA